MKELVWQFFIYGIPLAAISGLFFGIVFSYLDDWINKRVNKK